MGAPQPAAACLCGHIPGQLPLAVADAAFSGTAVARRDPPPLVTAPPSGGRFVPDVGTPIVYTFAVDGVAKGPVGRRQDVGTGHSNCAASFELGRRYEVYATQTGQGLMTGLCSGNRPLAAGAAPFGGLPGGMGEGRAGSPSTPLALLALLGLVVGAGAPLARWRARPVVWRRHARPGARRSGAPPFPPSAPVLGTDRGSDRPPGGS